VSQVTINASNYIYKYINWDTPALRNISFNIWVKCICNRDALYWINF